MIACDDGGASMNVNHSYRMRFLSLILQNMAEFKKKAGFPCVWGLIDCTHVVVSPGGEPDMRRQFYNRKRQTTLNVQMVVGPDMKIVNMVNTWPGSAHDSRIFRESQLFALLRHEEPGLGFLLGDAGYAIHPAIMVPFQKNSLTSHARKKYNKCHAKTRILIEQVATLR